MTFATDERTALAARIRYELGYSSVTVGGEPYFSHAYAPEVALDNLYTGAETTSVTPVTSTSTTSDIVLASATGFFVGARVHVDVGVNREVVLAQNLVTTTLTAKFAKTHTANYPVEVESGESMLRTILFKLDELHSKIQTSFSTGGIKKVDEVEFFGSGAALTELFSERNRWRNELGSLLKLPNLHDRRGNSTRLEAY